MSAPEWVDTTSTLCSADDAFHSGVTVDALRGNLLRSQEQSFISHTAYEMSELAYTKTMTSTSTWLEFSSWGYYIFPVRNDINGNVRPLTIRIQGKLSTGTSGTAKARIHCLAHPRTGYDEYYEWVNSYADVSFSTTTFSWASCTISDIEVGDTNYLPFNWTTRMPSRRPEVTYVQIVARCENSTTLTLSAPHFRETP